MAHNKPETSAERQTRLAAEAASVARGHETRDIHIGMVLGFAIALVAVVALLQPLLLGIFRAQERRADQADPQMSPLWVKDPRPPEPRLQSNDVRDMTALRKREYDELNAYRVLATQPNFVFQIPVERAMQLLLERGFPSPKPKSASEKSGPASQGQHSPDDAESGPATKSGSDASREGAPPKAAGAANKETR